MVVDPVKELVVTNGVGQGLGLFLDTFLDPGESVAMFDPVLLHVPPGRPASALQKVRSDSDHARRRLHRSSMNARWRKALKGARAILINSPNNPTGGVFTDADLERIAYWCKRRDVLIFSDEVYEHFYYGDRPANPRHPSRRRPPNDFGVQFQQDLRNGGVPHRHDRRRSMAGASDDRFNARFAPFAPTVIQRLAQTAPDDSNRSA